MKRLVTLTLVLALMLMASVNVFAQGLLEDTVAEKPYRIAVLLKTLANPFWVDMQEGVLEEAERLGVEVDVFAVAQEGDAEEQLRLFENVIAREYDGIAFAPITPVNLIPVISKANDLGIPVVNLDERVPFNTLRDRGAYVYSFVTTNNVLVGEQAAEFVIQKLGPAGGKVAVIEGMAGNVSGDDRRDGFTNRIKQEPGFEVVASQPANWDRTQALNVATNILNRHPELKAIYACNDTMALGALRAVENLGMDVIVVGTDGVPEAIEAVKEGRLAATIAQDPAMIGKVGLRLLVRALNIPQQVDVPSLVVAE
jgi:D-allose transport system substrate-binding protein